ncbi:hypothetical protein ABK040_012876 [Willaertia magna]
MVESNNNKTNNSLQEDREERDMSNKFYFLDEKIIELILLFLLKTPSQEKLNPFKLQPLINRLALVNKLFFEIVNQLTKENWKERINYRWLTHLNIKATLPTKENQSDYKETYISISKVLHQLAFHFELPKSVFKIAVIGGPATGKKSLINSFIKERQTTSVSPYSFETEFKLENTQLSSLQQCRVLIDDPSEMAKHYYNVDKPVLKYYMTNYDAFILLCDCNLFVGNSKNCQFALKSILDKVQEIVKNNSDSGIVICCNKIDELNSKQEEKYILNLLEETIYQFIGFYIPILLVSATRAENVEKSFEVVILETILFRIAKERKEWIKEQLNYKEVNEMESPLTNTVVNKSNNCALM